MQGLIRDGRRQHYASPDRWQRASTITVRPGIFLSSSLERLAAAKTREACLIYGHHTSEPHHLRAARPQCSHLPGCVNVDQIANRVTAGIPALKAALSGEVWC
jgi:hypothetical protein